MSTQVQIRRGTALEHQSFKGAEGEITFDTTNNRLVVHDGVTPGGHTFSIVDTLDPADTVDAVNGKAVGDYLESDIEKGDSVIISRNNLNGSLDDWKVSGGATTTLQADSVDITTANQSNSGISIENIFKENHEYLFSLKLTLISGTAGLVKIGNVDNVMVIPSATEQTVQGRFSITTNQNFVIYQETASGIQTFRVSDVQVVDVTDIRKKQISDQINSKIGVSLDTADNASLITGKQVADFIQKGIELGGVFGISFRKVNPYYKGNCIKVRRSSDNTTKDIPFKFGRLDEDDLLSFVGAGDGFIETWYEQFRGRDVTQTTLNAQPKIVSAGVLVTGVEGLPSALFDGTDDFLENDNFQVEQPFSFASVFRSSNDNGSLFAGKNGSFETYLGGDSQFVINGGTGVASTAGAVRNTDQVVSSIIDGANSTLRFNAVEDVSADTGSLGVNGITIGLGLSRFLAGSIHELIIFGYNLGAEINSVERNLTSEYMYTYPEKVNIVLVGGQSNADGRVPTTNNGTPPYLLNNKNQGLKVFNGSNIVEYDLGSTGSGGNGASYHGGNNAFNKYGFADVALRKMNSKIENLVVCRVTAGGSPIAPVTNGRGSWSTDYASIPAGTPKNLQILNQRLDDLISLLTAKGVSYEIKALLWHQGESDAALGEHALYETRFNALIAEVRNFTGVSNLPIIYGTLLEDTPDYTVVSNAQLSISGTDIAAYCRDNTDLTGLDGAHFDAESSNKFGQWMADLF